MKSDGLTPKLGKVKKTTKKLTGKTNKNTIETL